MPAAERAGFIGEQCSDDADMLAELRALLAAAVADDNTIEQIVQDAAKQLLDDAFGAKLDQRVGNYRLTELLGSGGMGNVYLAERADNQFQQQVAIKLLQPGRNSRELIERFELERQTLANLDHPNIARLLDGGQTPSGIPFLVLEYVDGQPIDKYCDEQRLAVADRLKLFQKICSAVGYAHRKLVVHRDIKPSNILVTVDGEPKLLDFGIAKLLDSDGVPRQSMATRAGGAAMTPEYASPEQVRSEPVSTATDIYSLGVLLYKMLCGRSPYIQRGLRTDLARAILDDEPSRPSTALSLANPTTGNQDSADEISAARQTTVRNLKRRLQGDLDNVVLKAMRKEPELRYESAADFAEDIDNVLEFRPVAARPAGLAYRAGRFLRRHPVGVTMAALFTIALLASFVRILHERNRAQIATVQAEQVGEFLGDLFASASPERADGAEITAGDLLAEGAAKINQLDDQPAAQARLLEIMGNSYLYIGDYDEGGELLRRALELRRKRLPYDASAIANNLRDLSERDRLRGRPDLAEQLLRESHDLFVRAAGPQSSDAAYVLSRIGLAQFEQQRVDEAIDTLREAIATKEALGEREDVQAIDMYGNLAIALDVAWQLDEAEAISQKVVAASRKLLGDKDPNTITRIANLGLIQMWQGNYLAAQRNLEEAYVSALEVRSTDALVLARAARNKGHILYFLGQFDAAMAAYREEQQYLVRLFERNDARVARPLWTMADVRLTAGEPSEARKLLEDAMRLLQDSAQQHAAEINSVRLRMAKALTAAGDYSGSAGLARAELAIADRLRTNTRIALQQELGVALSLQGEFFEAQNLLEAVLAEKERLRGASDISLIPTLTVLSEHHRRRGEEPDALPYAIRAHELGQTIHPPESWQAAFASAEYGIALRANGRPEADAVFQAAMDYLMVSFAADHPKISQIRQQFESYRSPD
jgi:serine/threonine-protein kinase